MESKDKIYPKEEPKQDYSGVHLRHCYQGEYEDGCKYGEDDCPAKPLEPKQETLEEASEKYSRGVWGPYYDEVHPDEPAITLTLGEISVKDFSRGAKWQAKRMYSEEDVYHILCEHTAFLFAGGKSTLSEWFEQYKKK
jgi:hypothetical protein